MYDRIVSQESVKLSIENAGEEKFFCVKQITFTIV
jgi:hypothetical protein